MTKSMGKYRSMKKIETYAFRLNLPLELFREVQYIANARGMTMVALISEWCLDGIGKHYGSLAKRLPKEGS